MGKAVTLSWPTHGKDLATGLWKLLKEDFKTDFQLSINGIYIKAHHLILAAFCSRVKSAENSTLILGEVPSVVKEDVEVLFKFIYCGQLDVDEDRLPALKVLSDLLGFKTLSDIILKFLRIKKQDYKSISRGYKSTKILERTLNRSKDLATKSEDKSANQTSPKKPTEESNNADTDNSLKTEEKSTTLVESEEFECKLCHVTFENFADLSVHLEAHDQNDVRFACQMCSYKASSRSTLNGHMINRHQVDLNGNPHPRNIQCPQCSYVCSANFQLKNHTYQVHSQKKKVCEECGYRCHSGAALEKHKILVHTSAKPLMCETCGYRAKIPAHLSRHMRVHMGLKVTCEICGTSVSVNYLSQHKRIHSSKPKPHRCPLCKFTSWKNWNLKFHLKTVHKMNPETSATAQEYIVQFASSSGNQYYI